MTTIEQQFKAKADKAAAYLETKGYPVKRTHLLEALARAEGARDWRTFKAGLVEVDWAEGFPEEMEISVFVETHHTDSYACSTYRYAMITLTTDLIRILRKTQAECTSNTRKSCIEIDESCSWLPRNPDHGYVSMQTLVVTATSFWFKGYEKHAEGHLETTALDLDFLLDEAKLVAKLRGKVLFYNINDNPEFAFDVEDLIHDDSCDITYISKEDFQEAHDASSKRHLRYLTAEQRSMQIA